MNRDDQRYAGIIVAETLQHVKDSVLAGERNTMRLNDIAESYMQQHNVIPACKGYKPSFHYEAYKYGTCLSINHEIVHGIPKTDVSLQDGDIVGIDIVGKYNGWHADAAITIPIGSVSAKANKLIEWTEKALYKGIKQAKAGAFIGDIGYTIQNYAQKHGLGIPKYLSGHSIGKNIHTAPFFPNRGKKGEGEQLQIGMSFCIEPMFSLGTDDNNIADDNWAVVTADKSLAAHFEHTILIGDDGLPEILTKLQV